MKILEIPAEYIHQNWPIVSSYLEEAFIYGGTTDYTLDQLLSLTVNGEHRLLVAMDDDEKIHGAATVTFVNYPNSRVAYVTSIGGKMIVNKDMWDQFSIWLREWGATVCRGITRESTARLFKQFGFEEKQKLVEVKLS